VTEPQSPAPPAQIERVALCDLLDRLGPDAPSGCHGWTTGDLAAHLVIRERRPDAAPGILIGALSGLTDRIQRSVRAATPYPQLVERIRSGPPRWQVYAGLDGLVNTVEYFVHHEDVRRAQPDWTPRDLPERVENLLWRRLSSAGFIMRKAPAEVTLVRPDGQTRRVSKKGKQVRVHGPVGELVLWVYGRTGVAQVRFTGDADAVTALSHAKWGV
jgi:uncharacterized protein (TIGR03085 family)